MREMAGGCATHPLVFHLTLLRCVRLLLLRLLLQRLLHPRRRLLLVDSIRRAGVEMEVNHRLAPVRTLRYIRQELVVRVQAASVNAGKVVETENRLACVVVQP